MSGLRLRGEAVEKRYGRLSALRGLDFQIDPGEAVSVLGANGAGKSSLLRILAGLSRPSAGRFSAEFAGSDQPASGAGSAGAASDEASIPRDRLRGHVGYVGHATLLYGELTARENLSFAAELHGQRPRREAIDRALAEAALEDVGDGAAVDEGAAVVGGAVVVGASDVEGAAVVGAAVVGASEVGTADGGAAVDEGAAVVGGAVVVGAGVDVGGTDVGGEGAGRASGPAGAGGVRPARSGRGGNSRRWPGWIRSGLPFS